MELKEGDKVELVIGHPTALGVGVMINELYEGMLYHNEIFQPLELDQRIEGYIKKIRDDGKIDVSLRPLGFWNVIDNYTGMILDKLKSNKGSLKLTDKSSPEEIYTQLNMSKKAFKNAVGQLYKLKKIRLEEDGIYLEG